MSVRVAVVQPTAHPPPDDERNVEEAVAHVAAAAEQGARFVAFPETYPGPWRMPLAFDPTPALVEAARTHRVYVQYGTLEAIDTATGTERRPELDERMYPRPVTAR